MNLNALGESRKCRKEKREGLLPISGFGSRQRNLCRDKVLKFRPWRLSQPSFLVATTLLVFCRDYVATEEAKLRQS